MDAGIDEVQVTAPRLAQILSTRLHLNVDERTIRRWAKAGKLTPLKNDDAEEVDEDGKTIYRFNARHAIDEAARMDRECPTCGRLWSGIGDVCGRCYATVNHGQPRYSERPDGVWVKVSSVPPRPVKSWPRTPVEDDICEHSDLPKAWCACRMHAV